MKNNEKAVIAGVGAILVYFLLEQNKDKEKKANISDVSISPAEFYA